MLAGNTPVLVHNSGCGPDLGPKWKPRPTSEICGSTGCENVAANIQSRIGGDVFSIKNGAGDNYYLGKYRGVDTMWKSHTVVVKDGRVFDAFTDRYGEPIDQWKAHWDFADILDFGF